MIFEVLKNGSPLGRNFEEGVGWGEGKFIFGKMM